jgi:Holliday junction DNA helicase RuvA
MIAGLRGRLARKTSDSLLIDVGGVIYRVGTSATTLRDVGDIDADVTVRTHLFVREDQLTLYGFASDDELRLFETLIGVSGVGPRLACAILSHMETERLHEAIAAENADYLATVPGVGKKTAARLILELRGKLAPLGRATAGAPASVDGEVVAALQALGYSAAEAHGAVATMGRQSGATVEERVIAALRELAAG